MNAPQPTSPQVQQTAIESSLTDLACCIGDLRTALSRMGEHLICVTMPGGALGSVQPSVKAVSVVSPLQESLDTRIADLREITAAIEFQTSRLAV